MIFDKDTNVVYLSKWLMDNNEGFPDFFQRLTKLLSELGIKWDLLKYTNDYWVRDFMPIQLEDKVFIKYNYHPDYLLTTAKEKETITNCSRTCACLGITYKETDIVIDGGNVVPCGKYIVMTNKVFSENKCSNNDPALLQRLEDVFGRKIIIIPWHQIKDDKYGHADGFIKYAGGNRILMSNHRDAEPQEATAIRSILEEHGFDVTELSFNVKRPSPGCNWAYINFLQVGNIIIMPSFHIAEDKQAKEQIQQMFPDCTIYDIRMNEIVPEGGALHCITWNIKE